MHTCIHTATQRAIWKVYPAFKALQMSTFLDDPVHPPPLRHPPGTSETKGPYSSSGLLLQVSFGGTCVLEPSLQGADPQPRGDTDLVTTLSDYSYSHPPLPPPDTV